MLLLGFLLATFHAGANALELHRLVELADPSLASTPEKRNDLKYLAACALPEGVELLSEQEGERFVFPGKIGLAPLWVSEGLGDSEERWISACMLAHTNYFGKHVEISLRAELPVVSFLRASEEEEARFDLFEGGFFGNLFSKDAVAYACSAPRTPEHGTARALKDRVCTEPSGERATDGRPITRCGFVLTGPCSDPRSFVVDGTTYSEVIFTYLEPTP